MKKVAKKGWCITAAVMAVSVIVCIFCFVRWERKSSDLSFQFEETTYTYKDEYYDVDKLVYLQMVGSRDKEKERKINQLLEDDRKKVMEMEPPDSYPDDGWEYRFHVGTHRCDVEYADEKFISISYSGWVVRQRKGPYGLPTTMMATTIDCEEMKVLELKDVVSDLNGLCQMLMEDRFKHITAWDGEPDLDFYKVSTTYSREGAERDLLETLNGNDREIEWYIKERKMSFSERWSAFWGDEVDRISEINVVTGTPTRVLDHVAIYPASHYVASKEKMAAAIDEIYRELDERVAFFKANDQLLEAQRISQRTLYDIEMMRELGYCSGIENYSRVIEGRAPGSPPHTLLDYFPKDFVLFIDESHVTLPQVRAMYNGDKARKTSLVDYGFRLPCAFDNRPLKFEEFESRIGQAVFVSATPGPYERERADNIVEQVIRPTGLLDPRVEVRPVTGQIDDLVEEIRVRAARDERVLVTTLTKRMAEDLTDHMKGLGLRVRYMHSDIATIQRMELIRDLRLGEFDVLVGINLLREGLDLPEVSMVAILDADKEGFLRSETSLIQTIGRAARNAEGLVVLYADTVTPSMKAAITETERRRKKQDDYNKAHGIVPQTIRKSVRKVLEISHSAEEEKTTARRKLTDAEREATIRRLEKEMKEASKMLEFEYAALLRDQIIELRGQK